MFRYLKMKCESDIAKHQVIEQEAKTLVLDAQDSITNERDLQVIAKLSKELNLYLQ